MLLFVGISPCGDLISGVVKGIQDITKCFHVADYFQTQIVEANWLWVDGAGNTQSDAAFTEPARGTVTWRYILHGGPLNLASVTSKINH